VLDPRAVERIEADVEVTRVEVPAAVDANA
jgi:hypothetical protein